MKSLSKRALSILLSLFKKFRETKFQEVQDIKRRVSLPMNAMLQPLCFNKYIPLLPSTFASNVGKRSTLKVSLGLV